MIHLIPAVLVLVIVFIIVHSRNSVNRKKVGVIVLGDVGRSPRMREHCLSLAAEGYQVQYIAGRGSTVHPDLLSSKKISLHLVSPFTLPLPGAVCLIVKPLWQSLVLLLACCRYFWASHAILMQNPPSIPVMGVVWFVSRLYGSRMIVDWHNYGYTILGLRFKADHFLVKASYRIERFFGRFADDNFCVTSAMSADLHENWGIKAYTLHDRPSSITSADLPAKHELFLKLGQQYSAFRGQGPRDTVFTKEQDSKIKERAGRPVLIVSSTSWTADEDFSLLLDALVDYDKQWTTEFPAVICAITGKGPLKSHYEEKIEQLELKHVQFVTCWLEPNDYPLLLACADLGVSLHYSSSGLDLPMKVVDMFASGIPVCARGFKCIKELVLHGKNGCVFNDSDHLCRQLVTLFKKFPNGSKNLSILREGVKHFQSLPWHYHWKHVALPVFDDDYVFEDFGPDPPVPGMPEVPHAMI